MRLQVKIESESIEQAWEFNESSVTCLARFEADRSKLNEGQQTQEGGWRRQIKLKLRIHCE